MTEVSVDTLRSLLDDEVTTLEALVSVVQGEHRALMTFETRALGELVRRKESLLEREDAVRREREAWVAARFEGGHLGEFLASLPDDVAAPLRERRERVRALLSALNELNQLALGQAARQLRWLRTRRRALGAPPPTYGRRGLESGTVAGLGLNASV